MKKENKDILETLKFMASKGNLHGCFADIPIEVYHHPDCPGWSSTQLKEILKKSYKHYEFGRGKTTKPTRFGSAFHCFVNEPETFVNTYQIIHGKGSEFLAPGKTALNIDDFSTIQKMAKKLFLHPDAGPLLQGAQHELTYFSVDNQTGVLKKCRLDAIKGDDVSDLKTCVDASEEAFQRDCRKYLYRISAAYYLEVTAEVLQRHLNKFYLIACEKSDPFEIKVYRVKAESLERGSLEIRQGLKIIQSIQEQGEKAWKGLPLGITDLSI